MRDIRGVALDIDDTLSSHGKLTPEAYRALWDLRKANYFVVPITGRPAGWCDHIARFWPVDAVVGENGAFTFFLHKNVRKRLETPGGGSPKERREKLKHLAAEVKKHFPKAKWASDQRYREFDLAIDFCEDVPPWSQAEVDDLVKLCTSMGAHAKVSSIHVNAWYGDYDKALGFKYWLERKAPGLQGDIPPWESWIFVGDSPNDEPIFEAFDQSIGVSNLKKFLNKLRFPPTWITQRESGQGFVEVVQKLTQLSPYR